MSRSTDWSQRAGIVIAFLALGTAVAVLVPRFLGLAAGDEAEIVTALKEGEAEGINRPPLRSEKLTFARISVKVNEAQREAEVLATLDFVGTYGDTELSSLGVERPRFIKGQIGWAVDKTLAPRLEAVLRTLEARRKALEKGDAKALSALARGGMGRAEDWQAISRIQNRKYRVRAWFIRLDHDSAEVTERFQLSGHLPERPVDQRGERKLSLVREGSEFFFSRELL